MRASIEAERESVVKDVRLRRLSTGGWCIVNGLMMRKVAVQRGSHAMAVSNMPSLRERQRHMHNKSGDH